MNETKVESFHIAFHDVWYIDRPPAGYEGGEVVRKSDYDSLVALNKALLLAATFVRNRLLQSSDSNWEEEINKLNKVIQDSGK